MSVHFGSGEDDDEVAKAMRPGVPFDEIMWRLDCEDRTRACRAILLPSELGSGCEDPTFQRYHESRCAVGARDEAYAARILREIVLADGVNETSRIDHVRRLLEENPDATFVPRDLFPLACGKGRANVVDLFLTDPRIDPNEASALTVTNLDGVVQTFAASPIAFAALNGREEVVRRLLRTRAVDPAAGWNLAIRVAAEYGRSGVVKLLLEDDRVDPAARYFFDGLSASNAPIRVASRYGHAEVVRLLLADGRVDPAAELNAAIKLASQNGHLAVVKLLCADRRVNASADDDRALHLATRNGHVAIVHFLTRQKTRDSQTDDGSEFAEIYTDGSCLGNPGPGGWGFVVYDESDREIFRQGGSERLTTNNVMEMTAVDMALTYVLGREDEARFVLFTDSCYVKNGLTVWAANWKKKEYANLKNESLWRRLHAKQEETGDRVRFEWVRAHAGNAKNEAADLLARSYAREEKGKI